MNTPNYKPFPLKQVTVQDPFWSPMQKLVTDVVIPYQEQILDDNIPGAEKSHALANFRITAGLEEGEYYGMIFQDSDVAKWLEGVAYSLCIHPDPDLERRADEIIDVIVKAQQDDGYLNTYFTIKEPEHRWQNLLEAHELYCAGHMMEAAVAYYEVTGKEKLLHVMERMADHIDNRFGEGKLTGIPGHQEIEIGLMRLFRATGKEKYQKLAQYFIETRGTDPDFFAKEAEQRDWVHFGMNPKDPSYCQAHATVYEQTVAVGHSVRAVYMYTAMADLAATCGDRKLYEACQTLWNNIVNKQLYITAGIGSTVEGEAFTFDYDLPNDSVYAETCASIGLVFFAKQMLRNEVDGAVTDVMERALYNGIISGMQLDGKQFFYVNPLEVNPGVSGELFGYKHVLPQRPEWYECACCPPNVVRLLTSLGQYAWDETKDTIYSHLYVGGTAQCEKAEITVESNYPWEGSVSYQMSPHTQDPFTLAIHLPAYAKQAVIKLNGKPIDADAILQKGYLYITRTWAEQDTITIVFDLPVRKVYANQAVRSDAGCVALLRGPLVYCLEGIDNGECLQSIRIPEEINVTTTTADEGPLAGKTLLKLNGIKLHSSDALYSEQQPTATPIELTAIPYYTWGNRGLTQMRVWLLEA